MTLLFTMSSIATIKRDDKITFYKDNFHFELEHSTWVTAIPAISHAVPPWLQVTTRVAGSEIMPDLFTCKTNLLVYYSLFWSKKNMIISMLGQFIASIFAPFPVQVRILFVHTPSVFNSSLSKECAPAPEVVIEMRERLQQSQVTHAGKNIWWTLVALKMQLTDRFSNDSYNEEDKYEGSEERWHWVWNAMNRRNKLWKNRNVFNKRV